MQTCENYGSEESDADSLWHAWIRGPGSDHEEKRWCVLYWAVSILICFGRKQLVRSPQRTCPNPHSLLSARPRLHQRSGHVELGRHHLYFVRARSMGAFMRINSIATYVHSSKSTGKYTHMYSKGCILTPVSTTLTPKNLQAICIPLLLHFPAPTQRAHAHAPQPGCAGSRRSTKKITRRCLQLSRLPLTSTRPPTGITSLRMVGGVTWWWIGEGAGEEVRG